MDLEQFEEAQERLVEEADGYGLPLLTVEEAVAKHLETIKRHDLLRQQELAELERKAEEQRQQWIAAMRERIALEYGIKVSDEDVAAWRLKLINKPDYYEFTWTFEDGSASPDKFLSLEAVKVGSSVELLWWSRYYLSSTSGKLFESLAAALTYAKTGQTL